ncbi:MAG: prepilin-type N-terminal cleavage/methylation domain-containing protein [Deltaproteobacteria bacterium]|nr:prepilin-type N-terminal cleavage/methylation domain-containing protein [Deltaproteobacteria bacterium]
MRLSCHDLFAHFDFFAEQSERDQYTPGTRIRATRGSTSHGAFLAPSRPGSAGFTLVELLVVVVIIGILAALAASDLSGLIGRYRLNSAARELAGRVSDCRMRAISENRECAVLFVTSDQNLTGPWRDNAGRYEQKVAEVTGAGVVWSQDPDSVVDLALGPEDHEGISMEPWAAIAGPANLNVSSAVVFGPQGVSTNPLTDFASGGVIRIVLRNKRASFLEQRVVRIDRGGNVQIAVP